MGTFTCYDDPKIDAVIAGHMQLISELCREQLGANLESLVLSGSFGRGEGSVIIHADGGVEPLRDYDLRLIVSRPIAAHIPRQIRDDFMRRSGLGQSNERFSGEQGFSITLEPLTSVELVESFLRDRDLRAYDFVHASRVLCGKDYGASLKFAASEIPLINGLRFLYKKMIGLIGHRSGSAIIGDVRRTLLYECDKTFVEICTALVLLAGAYVPSYRERAELFRRHWELWFPELAAMLPQLASQITRATQEKLQPGSTAAQDPHTAYADARQALLMVHRYYVLRLFGLELEPGFAGAARLRRVLSRSYFAVAVTAWLKRRRLNTAISRQILNGAYQRRLRFAYARNLGLPRAEALFHGVRAAEAPQIDIFLAAWCALAALGPEINQPLLQDAHRLLDRLPGPTAAWQGLAAADAHYANARERIIQAFGLWQGQR